MNEDRVIIWGCTPGMVIDEKYLPPPRPTPEGTYELFIRPESRAWTDDIYPDVDYELLCYDGAVITIRISRGGVDIGRQVISDAHRGAGRIMDLTGAVYPDIKGLLAAVTMEDS